MDPYVKSQIAQALKTEIGLRLKRFEGREVGEELKEEITDDLKRLAVEYQQVFDSVMEQGGQNGSSKSDSKRT